MKKKSKELILSDEKLFSEEEIQNKVKEIGKKLTDELIDSDKETVVICILKGSTLFFSDLVKEIKIPLIFDFMQVSSYKKVKRNPKIILRKDIDVRLMDRNVILIEDIIDTGNTINQIYEMVLRREPSLIKIVSLLYKPSKDEHKIKIDHKGFDIEDKFVVGYGLDYDEKYRNLPYITYMIKGK